MRNLLKKNQGSIAIEALASLFLLFVAVYVMWGVSILIYSQSKLTSATQLSSQAGILLANRVDQNTLYLSTQSPGGGINKGVVGVFSENICGMLAGQQSGSYVPGEKTCKDGTYQANLSNNEEAFLEIQIGCSENIEDVHLPTNCGAIDTSRSIKVSVRSQTRSPFSLINAAGGSTNENPSIESDSEVYSYSYPIP